MDRKVTSQEWHNKLYSTAHVSTQQSVVLANTLPINANPSGQGAIMKTARTESNPSDTSAEGGYLPGAANNVPNASCKYPLKYIWTFWYLEYDSNKSWKEMQNIVGNFVTANDFWAMYHRIKRPSQIKVGCDYSLFKQGIRPMWEDVANKAGGRWVISLPRPALTELDKIWLDVQLCLIGQIIDYNEQVCGAVVNVRSNINKISVWTSNGDDSEVVLAIGRALRDQLKLEPDVLYYELHKDVKTKSNVGVKPIYTV